MTEDGYSASRSVIYFVAVVGEIASIDRGWILELRELQRKPDKVGEIASIDRGWILLCRYIEGLRPRRRSEK